MSMNATIPESEYPVPGCRYYMTCARLLANRSLNLHAHILNLPVRYASKTVEHVRVARAHDCPWTITCSVFLRPVTQEMFQGS
jgi:hypothetical protein